MPNETQNILLIKGNKKTKQIKQPIIKIAFQQTFGDFGPRFLLHLDTNYVRMRL